MGKDKYENEDLIKYGLDLDVWFHVESLSSAHVYLRQREGESKKLDDLDPALLNECAQLVKANSIEGSKLKQCGVVYTRWANLKKTGDMAVGQIGYHDIKKQRQILVVKDKAVVNDLNRTKTETYPDLRAVQEERMAILRAEKTAAKREQTQREKVVLARASIAQWTWSPGE